MIFVTVGTTLAFDALIEAVDDLVSRGEITDSVVCQIGHGAYLPHHCDYFRFTPDIDNYVERASLVIGHGGTGTVTGLLASGKPFIVVANPLGVGNHQAQFLERLSQVVSLLWTADVQQVGDLINRATNFMPTALAGQKLTDDLREYLQRLS